MQKVRHYATQEVPTEFAAQLREMRDNQDPRLNTVLARARGAGWTIATLATLLGLKPAACSKRIERAEPMSRDAFARQTLRNVARRMIEAGRSDVGSALHALADDPKPTDKLDTASDILRALGAANRKTRTALGNLDKAREYRPTAPTVDLDFEIPEPIAVQAAPRVQAMMNGQRLERPEIDELLQMKEVASRVNGALEANHPDRKVSEKYSAKLAELIDKRGFTPYYLAKELGVTHRAITSRLERHGYRTPCPSVAGTPSGIYRGRKIGDPVKARKRKDVQTAKA